MRRSYLSMYCTQGGVRCGGRSPSHRTPSGVHDKAEERDEKVDISRGEAVRQELVLAVQASHWMKDELL